MKSLATSSARRARAATAVVRRGGRAVLSPAGLRGTVVEVAWVAAHLASYPFGIADEKVREDSERYTLERMSPIHRGLIIGDVEAAGTPILLLHGFVDNRSIFTLLRRALRRRGFGRIWTMNYHVLTSDVRVAAGRLARTIEGICEQTGYERIHVVGHSMGGLIARYYVQRMGGDARVHTLVTLGAPHAGTRAAHLLPRGICRQMTPGSDVVRELAAPAPGCRTRFVAFWSDLDALISPKRAARIDHPDLAVRNIFVRGTGHMSLPIDARVTREIAATLAHLDHDGTAVQHGLSYLPTPDAAAGEPEPSPRTRPRASRPRQQGRDATAG